MWVIQRLRGSAPKGTHGQVEEMSETYDKGGLSGRRFVTIADIKAVKRKSNEEEFYTSPLEAKNGTPLNISSDGLSRMADEVNLMPLTTVIDVQLAEATGRASQERRGVNTLDVKETVESGEKNEVLGRTVSNATSVEDPNAPEDESKYLKGPALAALTFGLCMATFVVALDNTIIATAIPRITTQFHSVNDVGWIGSSYLLTTTR